MAKSSSDLSKLFSTALKTLEANQQAINELDGHNGNHGDNMVQNLQLITKALKAKKKAAPSEALQYASQQLQKKGLGGTSQYYAQGLNQAANQLQGQSQLGNPEVMMLLQSLLGSIPQQGHPQQVQSGGTVLDQVLGLASAPQQQAADDGIDLGDVLNVLLPAGLSFLQAKQSGADNTAAALQALGGALLAPQTNPLQVGSPRGAAGGLIAQSILQALVG